MQVIKNAETKVQASLEMLHTESQIEKRDFGGFT